MLRACAKCMGSERSEGENCIPVKTTQKTITKPDVTLLTFIAVIRLATLWRTIRNYHIYSKMSSRPVALTKVSNIIILQKYYFLNIPKLDLGQRKPPPRQPIEYRFNFNSKSHFSEL